MKPLIQENIALAPLTTLKVGGAARFFVEAQTEEEILEAISFARENSLRLFVLGGGSNVLISDNGFDGLVLKIALKGITARSDETGLRVVAQAGEDWDGFVEYCVKKNLQGIECLSGIPGTVGGTPVQNVGAYGQEVSETIVSVRVLERATGKIFEMSNGDCGFAYRQSVFNTLRKDEFIVLAVTFRLTPDGVPKIAYRDLQTFFGESVPTLPETREAVIKIRAAKSMVIRAQDPNSRSAGSFFKNPVVSLKKFAGIESNAKNSGIVSETETIPSFRVDKETVKIPAAWLIEKSGFEKGFRLGKAGISTNHSLAIVNLGGAKARDVLALKDEIQTGVFRRFGIELKTEPVLVGF